MTSSSVRAYSSPLTRTPPLRATAPPTPLCFPRFAGELGEVRVWRGTSNAPGVAFSRSIGDAFAKDLGVIAEPAVTSSRLHPGTRITTVALCRG